MLWSWRTLLVLVVLVAGITVGYRRAQSHHQPKGLAGYVMQPPRVLKPLTLTDSAGQSILLSTIGSRGAALVYFGYTQCPDACPVTLASWQKTKRLLGDEAKRVRFVFITVDPDHDTPAALQTYLDHFDPAFVGLAGTKTALDSAQANFFVSSIENSPISADAHFRGSPHSVAVSVVDSLGRIRAELPVHSSAQAAATDLEQVLGGT